MSFDYDISMPLIGGNESFLNSNIRSKKGQSKKNSASVNLLSCDRKLISKEG